MSTASPNVVYENTPPKTPSARSAGSDWVSTTLFWTLVGIATFAAYKGLLAVMAHAGEQINLITYVFVGVFVGMIMLMMTYILHNLFEPKRWYVKLSFWLVYFVLLFINVALGFSYFYNVLRAWEEGTGDARRTIERSINEARESKVQVETVAQRLKELADHSIERRDVERTRGNSWSCPSAPGEGPLRRKRDDDAATFTAWSDEVQKVLPALLEEDKSLNAQMKLVDARPDGLQGTREDEVRKFKDIGQRVRAAAFSLNQRAETVRATKPRILDRIKQDSQAITLTPAAAPNPQQRRGAPAAQPQGRTVVCSDPLLVRRLEAVVAAIDRIPVLTPDDIVMASEGESVYRAFSRLNNTFAGVPAQLVSSVTQGFAYLTADPEARRRLARQQAERQASGGGSPQAVPATDASARAEARANQGLQGKDYLPLSIAIFVDLCLLLLALDRPRRRAVSQAAEVISQQEQEVAKAFKKLNKLFSANDLANRYTIKHHGKFHVVVPNAGSVDAAGTPRSEPKDDAMRLAMRAMDDLGLFDEVQYPMFMGIRKKLAEQGVVVPKDTQFKVWRARKAVVPQILRELISEEAAGAAAARAGGAGGGPAQVPPGSSRSAEGPRDQGRTRASSFATQGGGGARLDGAAPAAPAGDAAATSANGTGAEAASGDGRSAPPTGGTRAAGGGNRAGTAGTRRGGGDIPPA